MINESPVAVSDHILKPYWLYPVVPKCTPGTLGCTFIVPCTTKAKCLFVDTAMLIATVPVDTGLAIVAFNDNAVAISDLV